MRPFTAMGAVHLCTPAQALAAAVGPALPSKTVAPVSPSTPMSLVLFMNQTMAFDVPSVVVAIGDAGKPSEALLTGMHHAGFGASGVPDGINTEITALPFAPAPVHCAPLLTVSTTCIPCAVA